MGNLSKLEELYLEGNKLAILPETILKLNKLTTINIKQNTSLKLSSPVKQYLEDKKI